MCSTIIVWSKTQQSIKGGIKSKIKVKSHKVRIFPTVVFFKLEQRRSSRVSLHTTCQVETIVLESEGITTLTSIDCRLASTTAIMMATSSEVEAVNFGHLQEDCLQSIINFLTATDGFCFLSNVSNRLRLLRSNSTLCQFTESEQKRFVLKVLKKSLLRVSILNFGLNEGNNLDCAKINGLIKLFQQMPPILNEKSTLYKLQSIEASADELTTLLRGKVAAKNIRSASLLIFTCSEAWITICAFQCTNSKRNCADRTSYMPASEKPCRRSYSIGKCSLTGCSQPNFLCDSCQISCYECNKKGLCSACIYEIPNSGDVVFVCASCRGY